MRFRSTWLAGMVSVLVATALMACVAQPISVPARSVEVSMDQALTAQNKLGDLMMGNVEWTESEFSSLLSVLLEQNAGENNPIQQVLVWFEPDNEVAIRVLFLNEVLPGVSQLDVVGTVSVEGNHVVVDVAQAGAGNISLSGDMLPAINDQINAALADPQLGVAADVETDTGVIRLSLGE